jgi:hypothetical protein
MNDLEQIARMRPDVEDPSPYWLDATRTAMLERRSWTPRRPRRSILAVAAAVVAVLATIAVAMPGSSALTAAAHDQYYYVKLGFKGPQSLPMQTTEEWFPVGDANPVQPWQRVCDHETVTGMPYRCHPMSDHSAVLEPDVPLGNLSVEQFRALPTDTDQLRAKVYEQARQWLSIQPSDIMLGGTTSRDTDQQAFLCIEVGLQTGRMPQPQVEALYRVLQTIPGVRVTQQATDGAGRQGVGVSREAADTHGPDMLVFDRETHRFLGGSVFFPGWTVVLDSGPVAKVGDHP